MGTYSEELRLTPNVVEAFDIVDQWMKELDKEYPLLSDPRWLKLRNRIRNATRNNGV